MATGSDRSSWFAIMVSYCNAYIGQPARIINHDLSAARWILWRTMWRSQNKCPSEVSMMAEKAEQRIHRSGNADVHQTVIRSRPADGMIPPGRRIHRARHLRGL